ncbi:MAG: M24 family metallopeptidase [Candidatus Binatia bacterium]
MNVPRAERILADHGLDGLLAATNIPNVFYLCGIWRRADVAAIVHRDRLTAPWVVLPRSEVDYLVGVVPPVGVVTYGTFYRNLYEAAELTQREARIKDLGVDLEPVPNFLEGIAKALPAAGLEKGAIGYDQRGLDPVLLSELQRKFPNLAFRPAAAIFREIRSVKTDEEVRIMSQAVQITEEAFVEAASQAREGMKEEEMSLVFEVAQVKRGAHPNMGHVGFGRNAALGMTNVPDDRLRPGDMIRFDGGCLYRGYASDLSRTFAFGQLSDKLVCFYKAIVRGQDVALEMIKPGVTGAEIFEAAVKEVRQTGIPHYRRQHVGHGLGLGLAGYDRPLLAPGDHAPLEAGMVLCVETPYYELGWGGVQIEDMVVVTADGYRRLSTMSRDLQILPLRR